MAKELIIKHVRFTFDEWNRSIQKKTIYQSEEGNIRAALISIEKVKKPQVWDAFGMKIKVAEDGYRWLVVSQKNENYVITMYMNEKMDPIIWYIDMCDGQGIDDDGVYYFNDIFLDLLVSNSKEVMELDRDEMEQAYDEGIITDQQKRLAIETAEKIKDKISSSPDWIYDLCMNVLENMQKKITVGNFKIYE